MRQIREILRYHFEHSISNEKIGRSLRISKGSVFNTLDRFRTSSLDWPLPKDLTDSQLEALLYPVKQSSKKETNLPSQDEVRYELSRPHVTMQLLYEEYQRANPDGLKRSAFYRYCKGQLPPKVTMKMHHKAGDKLFVDYSGDSLCYIDRLTGEVHKTELFVCSWGASNYSYAEVTESQNQEDFALSHVRAFAYFGCTSQSVVPDNLKSAVTKAKRYDPVINRLYGEMCEHYNLVVLPARVAKPQDKAVVESNVKHIQHAILGTLRDRQFFSLAEINKAVREELERFNHRPMKSYGNQSRKERFDIIDKPAAQPLPNQSFEITKIKTATVAPNYHVLFEKHFYSVPYEMVTQKVELYLKGNIVEIYHNGTHLYRHRKGASNGGYTTITEHMPSRHKFVKGWSPGWFIFKAGEISEDVATAVKTILENKRHPEQAYNSALGVLRFAKAFTPERLSAACRRAAFFKSVSYRSIKSILEKGLDKQFWGENPEEEKSMIMHQNIRGNDYYKEEV